MDKEFMKKMHKKEFIITGNAVTNLCRSYADIVISRDRIAEEYDYEDLEEVPDYMYDDGYLNAMEMCLRAIGIHPSSPYVQMIVEEKRKNYED